MDGLRKRYEECWFEVDLILYKVACITIATLMDTIGTYFLFFVVCLFKVWDPNMFKIVTFSIFNQFHMLKFLLFNEDEIIKDRIY